MRARLLYSSRTLEGVIYRAELDAEDVVHTLTRAQPPGWTGYVRRVDADLLREVAWPAEDRPLAFGGDMTTAQAKCGRCGVRGPLAQCEVYVGGPGIVVRCRVCHDVVMVLVEVAR